MFGIVRHSLSKARQRKNRIISGTRNLPVTATHNQKEKYKEDFSDKVKDYYNTVIHDDDHYQNNKYHQSASVIIQDRNHPKSKFSKFSL